MNVFDDLRDDSHGLAIVVPRMSHADQALIQRVTEEVEAESGVELDQLINPAKVKRT